MLHQTNWISLPLDAHILPTCSSSSSLMSKEDWKEREQWGALSFHVIIFSVSGWLTQGSNANKKRYNRSLGCLCSLKSHCLFFCDQRDFSLNKKRGLFGLCPDIIIDVTCFPVVTRVSLNVHTLWVHQDSMFTRPGEHYTWTVDTHIVCISSAHVHDPLSHDPLPNAQVQR